MENQTYPCRWKRIKGGFQLSLKGRPRLAVIGKTFEEAEDDLHGLVCGEFGDGESVFEFDPPPPVATNTKSCFEPEMFVFSANDYLRQKNDEIGLYSKGYCGCCGGGLGRRTKKVRTLVSVPKCDVSFIWSAKPQVFFFSKRVVAFLRRVGLGDAAFREVGFAVKTSHRFFELVAEPEIKFVGVKRPPRRTGGWECAMCGMKWIHPFHGAVAPSVFNFLARPDLSKVSKNVFVTGSSYERDICMTAAIAARLRQLSGLKGILTSRVAVLDEHEVDRNPKVQIVKKGGF